MSTLKQDRRSFIGLSFGSVAAVGGVFALGGMKQSWDPLPSVPAAAVTTIDLSPLKDGYPQQTQRLKKPVFILNKTAEMPKHAARDLVVAEASYTL